MLERVDVAACIETPMLQGRQRGREHYIRLCDRAKHMRRGGIVLLDFSGCQSITGSWINTAIAPFYRWAAEPSNDVFPVLTNLRLEWAEEFDVVGCWNGQAYLVADLKAHTGIVVGKVESPYLETYDAVVQLQQATGAQIVRHWNQPDIKATAVNNRLKELYDKRLLLRRKHGREQIYKTVYMEVDTSGRQLFERTVQESAEAEGSRS